MITYCSNGKIPNELDLLTHVAESLIGGPLSSQFPKKYNGKVDEATKNFLYELEVPGVKRSDIDVSIEENNVKIAYKNRFGIAKADTFSVSNRWDLATLTAKYEDGLLVITVKPSAKYTRAVTIN